MSGTPRSATPTPSLEGSLITSTVSVSAGGLEGATGGVLDHADITLSLQDPSLEVCSLSVDWFKSDSCHVYICKMLTCAKNHLHSWGKFVQLIDEQHFYNMYTLDRIADICSFEKKKISTICLPISFSLKSFLSFMLPEGREYSCCFICPSVHLLTSCLGHNSETAKAINKKLCR